MMGAARIRLAAKRQCQFMQKEGIYEGRLAKVDFQHAYTAMLGSMFLMLAAPLPVVQAVTDGQAPTAPGNVSSVWSTSTSIHLVWTPSTDNEAVTGYEVYDGSALLAVTPTGSPNLVVTDLTEGANHTFTVKARDGAGNVSAASPVYASVYGTLDRGSWEVTASLKPEDARLAVDSSSTTRWTTGIAQNTGMYTTGKNGWAFQIAPASG